MNGKKSICVHEKCFEKIFDFLFRDILFCCRRDKNTITMVWHRDGTSNIIVVAREYGSRGGH